MENRVKLPLALSHPPILEIRVFLSQSVASLKSR
jgi:hypothetical protein